MNSGTFIRSASKLPPSGTAKAPPARNPPIKRKRPDEPFQRSVQAKMTPSNDIYSRRDSGFISIPKLAINSGIASASKLSIVFYFLDVLSLGTTTYSQTAVKAKTVIQSRTTFQTPAAQSTTKKGRGTTPVTTRVSNTKVDIKISSIGMVKESLYLSLEKGKSDEKSDVKETMMISPVKKSLNIEHFEGLASVSKEIDSEKDNLLSNLNNLVEELTGKQNPLLEENDNKLFLMQDTFEKQKVQQKEELEKLNSKINNLKNAQSSLSRLFEENKEKTSIPEQENQAVDLNV